jgi:hypothetical protein
MHTFSAHTSSSFGNTVGRSRDTSLRRTSSGVTGHGQHSVRIRAAKTQQEHNSANLSRTFTSKRSESGSSSASSCGNTKSSSSTWGSSSSSSRCDSAVHLGRRALLSSFSLGLCAATQAANAASVPAVAPAPGGSLASQLNKALPFPLFPVSPPEPIGFPRKQLDTRFAVLLMRSSYDAVDALDFIPRQQFEVSCSGAWRGSMLRLLMLACMSRIPVPVYQWRHASCCVDASRSCSVRGCQLQLLFGRLPMLADGQGTGATLCVRAGQVLETASERA